MARQTELETQTKTDAETKKEEETKRDKKFLTLKDSERRASFLLAPWCFASERRPLVGFSLWSPLVGLTLCLEKERFTIELNEVGH